MNDMTEVSIDVETKEIVEEVQQDFPYSFAKRNGVVLQYTPDGKNIVHFKKGLTPTVANEVQRFLNQKPFFQLMPDDEFDHLLALNYDNSGAGASAMM